MSNQPNQEKLKAIQQTILPKTIIQQIPSQRKSQYLYQLKIKKQEQLYNQDDLSDRSNLSSIALSSSNLASSNKILSKKYRILTTQQKWEIVKKSWATSVKKAATQFQVSPNNICRWRKGCERKPGAGRKITDYQMEAKLFQWFSHQNLGTLKKKTIQKKAKQLSKNPQFKASKGWYQRFMKRNDQLSHYLIKEEPPKGLKPIMSQQIQNFFRQFKARWENKVGQQSNGFAHQNKEKIIINERLQYMNQQNNREKQCKIQEQFSPLKSLFQSQSCHVKQQYIYDVLNLGHSMLYDETFSKKK